MRDVAMLESFTARNMWKELLHLAFEHGECVGTEGWPPPTQPTFPGLQDIVEPWEH